MRTYLKAFLFLALTASIACAGANFAQAAETAPAASAGNGMMPPVGTFDNNAAYQALTPEKQAKYNEIVKSAETCPIRVFAGVPRSVPAAVSTCSPFVKR